MQYRAQGLPPWLACHLSADYTFTIPRSFVAFKPNRRYPPVTAIDNPTLRPSDASNATARPFSICLNRPPQRVLRNGALLGAGGICVAPVV